MLNIHYILNNVLSTRTQSASICVLTAAAPSDSVFRACEHICLLTYSLTYLMARMLWCWFRGTSKCVWRYPL